MPLLLRPPCAGYLRLSLSCWTRVYPLMTAPSFTIKFTNVLFLMAFASDKVFLWLSCEKNRLRVLCLPFTLRDTHRYQGNTVVDKLASGVQAPAELFIWTDIEDRKSTRLNSSHVAISYAVF